MKTIGKKPLSFLLSALLVFAAAAVPMPANAADLFGVDNITIINNSSPDKDVIHITSNLRVGDYVVIVDQIGSNAKVLFTSTKAKGTSLRFEVPSGILDDGGGTICMNIMSPLGNSVTQIKDMDYNPASQSLPPLEKNIIVTNNDQSKKGAMPSKVNITGLRSGDVFYVYLNDPGNSSAASRPTNIGVSGIASATGSAEAKVKVNLDEDGGTVWITVKSTGRAESKAVSVTYSGIDNTTGSGITVKCVNNYGPNDKVIVTGVYPSDQVEVYDADTDRLLGSGRVLAKRTDIEISVKAVGGVGLDAEGGKVWVIVTTPGKSSLNVGRQGPFQYPAEGKSTPINNNSSGAAVVEENGNKTTIGDVTIYRYVGKMDTIEIKNLNPQDTVTVYTNVQAPQTPTLLKSIKVAPNATSVAFSMKLPDIPDGSTDPGSILIYVTSVGMQQSDGVVITYGLPLQSEPLLNLIVNPPQTKDDSGMVGTTAPAVVAVTNTALTNNDEIFVTNVEPGDKIYIYKNELAPTSSAVEKALNTLNTGTVASKKTAVSVKAEFPTADAGTVYVSIAKVGQKESTRIPVDYLSQNKTTAAGITFNATNYAGSADKFIVSGAEKGMIITVYAGNGSDYKKSAIKGAYAKVANAGTDLTMTFAFPTLTPGAVTGDGILYVGVQKSGLEESDLVPVTYDPEPGGSFDSSKFDITVHNNYGTKDYVVFAQEINVASLQSTADIEIILPCSDKYPGHTLIKKQTVISIYGSSDLLDKKKIGTLTIDGTYPTFTSGGATYIQRSVTVNDLNASTGGSIWYTFTYPGKTETQRIELKYDSEQKTENPSASAITVINNINTGNVVDYVIVTCSGVVTVGSIIKVYTTNDTKTTEICKATVTQAMVSAGAVKMSLTGKNLLDPNSSGSLWVSVQMLNMSESDRVKVDYYPAGSNPTVTTSYTAIAIDNQGVNIKDAVFVYGLQPGDIVKLGYRADGASKDTVTTMTVGAKQSSVIFNMYIPGGDGTGYGWNTGYITVTTPGKAESAPILLKDIRNVGYSE